MEEGCNLDSSAQNPTTPCRLLRVLSRQTRQPSFKASRPYAMDGIGPLMSTIPACTSLYLRAGSLRCPGYAAKCSGRFVCVAPFTRIDVPRDDGHDECPSMRK